jgi:cytochrome c oxidase subunit 2
VLLLGGCGDQGVFDGAGRQGRDTANLGVVLFAIAGAVFVLVTTTLLIAALRRPGDAEDGGHGDGNPGPLVYLGGIALPVVTLTSVFLLVLPQLNDQNRTDAELVVEVTGHQWWWELHYDGFTTANELHVPVGRRVRLELTSDDVIHSFWVPSLNGKRDAIPGTTTELVIEAERPGRYTGSCAEYCGLQHAEMGITVVAQRSDDYERWAREQAKEAPDPRTDLTRQGRQVFLGSSCVYCHQVRGTSARSELGPDLTHLMSRSELASGMIPNDRGHLAGWITDAPGLKPGTEMPAFSYSGEELQALLAYLETLR